MTDRDAELLQEACDDVVFLTNQGYTPTDAVVKVAAAAEFPRHKTRLLAYAYSNGMSSEKRASAGGLFDKLGEFALPDLAEIERQLYDLDSDSSSTGKTASSQSFNAIPMSVYQTDIAGKSRQEIYDLLGMGEKTAEFDEAEDDSDDSEDDDDSPKGRTWDSGHGLTVSRTTILISSPGKPGDHIKKKCDCGEFNCKECYPTKAGSLKEAVHRRMPKMPEHVISEMEPALIGLLNVKSAAMHSARQAADIAYAETKRTIDEFQQKVRNHTISPQFKRAGLLSVRAYYPEVAELLSTCVDEVTAKLVKQASHSVTDITIRHPWVADAKSLTELMQDTVEKTVEANRKSAEYGIICDMYRHRAEFRKEGADLWSYAAGMATNPMMKKLFNPGDQSDAGAKVQQKVLDSLDDRFQEMNLRDIETQSMLNDFATHDEILKAYDKGQLIRGYNELLRTAPDTMRTKPQARALLQQYMTQGRMAPTELMPAMQMNQLDPRKSLESSGKPEKTEKK